MNKPVFKTFALKGEMDGDTFSGVANMLGIMDRGGDVMAPGCFSRKCLDSFLKQGFVPVGHDWSGLPVAMPKSAREKASPDGSGLLCLSIEAKWHSTEAAEETRKIVKERLAEGLECGLSIGFMPDYDKCKYFESGKALWKFLSDSEEGVEGYDEKTIKNYPRWCCLMPAVKELFEVSIVSVPMNQRSGITEAKSLAELHVQTKDLEDQGLSLDEEATRVLTASENLLKRLTDLSGIRAGQDREPLSAKHIAWLGQLKDALDNLMAKPEAKQTDVIDVELLRLQAQALDLAI